MHFFRLFLAFIQKLCLVSFHFFQKIIKRGVGIRVGGWKIFQKLISGGGTIIRHSRVIAVFLYIWEIREDFFCVFFLEKIC